MKLKTLKNIVVVVTLAVFFGALGYWLGERYGGKISPQAVQVPVDRSLPADKSHLDLGLFWEVWDRLERDYFDKTALKTQKMIWGAIKGMTASLGDPYTTFLPPKENQRSKADLNGKFEGVGIELGYKDGVLAVVSPLEGMPAKAAGIKAGDLIVHIKDEVKNIDVDTIDMSLPEAVEIIRGPKGSAVELTVIHDDTRKEETISITRNTILVPSVELSWEEGTPHLQLYRFGDRTADEWDQAVSQIVSQCRSDCPGLVLDLRGNPGGYLEGSVNLASEFIASGVVVKQENANGSTETYSVNRKGRLTTMPIVVLVNQGSASSSEILAGAIRVKRQAPLVGQTTFGKGTIQEAQELGGGAGLHVTTAKWLLPDGTWVHEKGLTPDHEVKDDPETPEVDEQLQKAVEVLKDL